MSLNEKKDGEDPNKLAVSQNIQDELAHVIHTSLTNIATQIDNLNKHVEGILGALYKEVDKISCRYNTLQKQVIQLNNIITVKETSKESLKATKPKSSQSASIQTELDYPSSPLPAKICNTRDASVQTSSRYISSPYCQDNRQVLAISKCQNTENSIIPCYQDDLMTPYCQHTRRNVMIPYCIDNDQGLVILPEISYYFENCEEKFVSGVKERVQKRVRKKNQQVSHRIEPEKGPQFTLMGNDNVGHIPPTCTELSHSHLSAECSVFSTCPIKEISKVLTQAVGKVLANSPHPQRKKVGYLRNKDSYVSNGVGKKEIKPPAPIKNHAKLDVFVSPSPPASPPPLELDWLPMLRDSKTESPASKIHSQTLFSSPVFRTPTATHRCDCLQTSLEVGSQTTEEDFFTLAPSPPESYEMIAHNLPKQNNKKGESPPMCTSPVLLRRTKAREEVSDLLVRASFAQSPPSLDYPSSRLLFSESPKLSASKSPRLAILSTPRSSHQPPTRYIDSACSKSSNAAVPSQTSLESYQSSVPLSESFSLSSGSSVSSSRCASDYVQTRSVSPRRLSERASRFSVPSSGNTYIEQSTGNLVPPSQQPSSLKSQQSITLQSVFSFPQSASSSVPSPPALSVFQYSADSVSPDSKQPAAYSKGRNTLMDSIRKGVLLLKTEEHCILKAQIEISKK